MGTSKSGSREEAVDDGRVLVKEGCGGAWGHSGAVQAGFRSQEHFQKREVKIHQMGKAHTAKRMPQSVWKWGKDGLRQRASPMPDQQPRLFQDKVVCLKPSSRMCHLDGQVL